MPFLIRGFVLLLISALVVAPEAMARDGGLPVSPVRFDGDKVVRVTLRNLQDVRTLNALSSDPWSCSWDGASPGRVSFRVTPDAYEALVASGIPFSVQIPDVQVAIDNERPPFILRDSTWYADYKQYSDVVTYLNGMVAARPDLASRVTVGSSLLGVDMPCIRISSAAPGTKPAILVIGCQHAREWITVMATTYVADTLVNQYSTDPAIKQIVDNYEVFILPIANPDGYQYTWSTNRLWRKNLRSSAGSIFGVDLNRNWGTGWGGPGSSSSTSDDTYRGPSAFSEPETTALKNFAIAHPNLALFFDIHSFSELVMSPNGYTPNLTSDARAYDQLVSTVQSAIYANSGVTYYAGPTYMTIYPASGVSNDWTYASRGIMSLSLELRPNASDPNTFLLPAAQILPTAQEWFAGFKAAVQWMNTNQVAVSFPNALPTTVQSGTTTNVLVQFNHGLKAVSGTPTVSARFGRVAPFTTVPVTNAGTDESGQVYSHTLSAGICGSVVQWYYTVQASDGSTVYIPSGGPLAPYEAVANTWNTVFSDDFEIDRGWLVGDPSSPDTASTGIWTRAVPNGYQAQVEFDHTPLSGTQCFITGQNLFDSPYADTSYTPGWVSGGKTTLRSPVFNLAAAPNAQINLWIAFFNDRQYPPNDPLEIDITNNASSPTWVPAVYVAGNASAAETTGRWRKYTIPVAASVTPTSAVQIRVVASSYAADGSGLGNFIEVAVDDVSVTSPSCSKTACRADFNGDGLATVQDIFDFLSAWFMGAPAADFNHSGAVSIQDIFDFLGAWFAGCP